MYPVRALVQEENEREFNALKTPIQTYNAIDEQVSPDGFQKDMLYVLKDLQAANEIKLRIGAQVMLLANVDVRAGLVNGSRGVITDFVGYQEAIEFIRASTRDESTAVSELSSFMKDNTKMVFPKVLFEVKDELKEVCPSFERLR
jgi:hypothetical protein